MPCREDGVDVNGGEKTATGPEEKEASSGSALRDVRRSNSKLVPSFIGPQANRVKFSLGCPSFPKSLSRSFSVVFPSGQPATACHCLCACVLGAGAFIPAHAALAVP